MVDKIENVQRGDLVELVLKANAKKFVEAQIIFIADKTGETNIPGRNHVGYLTDIKPEFISLTSGMNRIKDRISDNLGSTRFYLDAIEDYSKTKRDW